jgi:hypothetical protein
VSGRNALTPLIRASANGSLWMASVQQHGRRYRVCCSAREDGALDIDMQRVLAPRASRRLPPDGAFWLRSLRVMRAANAGLSEYF